MSLPDWIYFDSNTYTYRLRIDDMSQIQIQAELGRHTEEQLEGFLQSLDSFDEEYSLTKYDTAVISDCITAVHRITQIRKRRAEKEL